MIRYWLDVIVLLFLYLIRMAGNIKYMFVNL